MLATVFAAGTPDTMAQTKKDTPIKKPVDDTATKKTASLAIELYKDTAGEFRFRIKDGDTLLATSGKGYDTKDECRKVIDDLKANLNRATMNDHSDDKPKAKSKPKDK